MSENNTLTPETDIIPRLQRIEKGILDSKNYQRDAMTQEQIFGNQLKENDEELKQVGTTPQTVEEDIQKLDKEILELIALAESKIPFDELKKREEKLKAQA